jgi:hypothetical protein
MYVPQQWRIRTTSAEEGRPRRYLRPSKLLQPLLVPKDTTIRRTQQHKYSLPLTKESATIYKSLFVGALRMFRQLCRDKFKLGLYTNQEGMRGSDVPESA